MKALELQDMHVSPAWINQAIADTDRVCRAIDKHKVDLIQIAGDTFHRSVMANSNNRWKDITNIGRKMQSSAQVYFIYGTRTHDNDDAYESFKDIGWKEVSINKHYTHGNLLITGLPEITQESIIAAHPEMNREEVIQSQYTLVQAIFDQYYAPIIKNHNGHSVFMGHGHVSGMKFNDKQKPRTSEFMYSEAMLQSIGAERYHFGHIHLEQYFKTLWGGYGGSMHITWNDTGFRPGFNIVDYDNHTVERIYLDSLERKKIIVKSIEDFSAIDKTMKKEELMDYWVEIECDEAASREIDTDIIMKELTQKHKPFLGPNSKVSKKVSISEKTRVSADEYEACNSLEDLYKIWSPDATDSILRKVREAEVETEKAIEHQEKKTIEFLSLYVRGGKAGLENGYEEFFMDFTQIPFGSSIIEGANGEGKSFYTGFLSPFSLHLSKLSDFKGMFDLKDSEIIRKLKVNDDIVTQKIQIDPTLKTPKMKFYMDINGKPVEGCKGNKKDFDAAVENIFGDLKSYMSFVFKTQKELNDAPSLENAKESDLRDIFTHLSGTDRTPVKEFAHGKVVELKKKGELDLREIETLEGTLENQEEILKSISETRSVIADKENLLSITKNNLQALTSERETLLVKKRKNTDLQSEISKLKENIETLENEINSMNRKKMELGNIDPEAIKKEIADIDSKMAHKSHLLERLNILDKDFTIKKEEYSNATSAIEKEMSSIEVSMAPVKARIDSIPNEINSLNSNISNLQRMIDRMKIPCEHCGKLSSKIVGEIQRYEADIHNFQISIQNLNFELENNTQKRNESANQWKSLKDQLSAIKVPETPEEITRIEYDLTQIPNNLQELKNKASEKLSASETLTDTDNTIKANTARISEIQKEIQEKQLQILPVDEEKVLSMNNDVMETNQLIENTTSEIASLKANIDHNEKKIESDNERRRKIQGIKDKTGTDIQDLSEWQTIESAFSPKGIPAMELSLIAPLVDRRANEFLDQFAPRFQVETITQDFDSSGNLAEKFKILVHDDNASEIKNLPVISGGQAVWVTRAMRDSLAYEKNKRSGISWLYGIEDETDAALDHDKMAEYYEMLDLSSNGRKVLSISHSPEAKSVAKNIYRIKDFYGNKDN